MRLFAAYVLDEPVRAALGRVQKSLAPACPGIRWVAMEQLHLTVKFLGEVPDTQVKDVSQAIGCGILGATPFTMTIAGCGCFPPRGLVRIVWAAAADPSGEMLRCVANVNHELERLGFPPENRPWSPHVTIGRAKDGAGAEVRAATQAQSFAELRQMIDSVVLMSSVLSPKGPTYTPIFTAKFEHGKPQPR